MRRVPLPPTPQMIRGAVVITIIGLLLLLPIVLTISALAVGLFMLGSLLLTLGIALYVIAVVRELQQRRAL